MVTLESRVKYRTQDHIFSISTTWHNLTGQARFFYIINKYLKTNFLFVNQFTYRPQQVAKRSIFGSDQNWNSLRFPDLQLYMFMYLLRLNTWLPLNMMGKGTKVYCCVTKIARNSFLFFLPNHFQFSILLYAKITMIKLLSFFLFLLNNSLFSCIHYVRDGESITITK